MAGGLALVIVGVWGCVQILGGHALERLKVVPS